MLVVMAVIPLRIRTINNNKVDSSWVAGGHLGTDNGPWFCCFKTNNVLSHKIAQETQFNPETLSYLKTVSVRNILPFPSSRQEHAHHPLNTIPPPAFAVRYNNWTNAI